MQRLDFSGYLLKVSQIIFIEKSTTYKKNLKFARGSQAISIIK